MLARWLHRAQTFTLVDARTQSVVTSVTGLRAGFELVVKVDGDEVSSSSSHGGHGSVDAAAAARAMLLENPSLASDIQDLASTLPVGGAGAPSVRQRCVLFMCEWLDVWMCGRVDG